MKRAKSHRKTVKHFEDPSHVRERTFSCYRRMPLLTNDPWREMLSRAIDEALEKHNCRLAAFVFMPEHLHLMLFPVLQASKMDCVLMAIKRPVSFHYIHENPVRRGLCERAIDWRWSSARWYLSDGSVVDDALPKLTRIPADFWS